MYLITWCTVPHYKIHFCLCITVTLLNKYSCFVIGVWVSYYLIKEGQVFVCVCLFVIQQDHATSAKLISVKFCGVVGHNPREHPLSFCVN